jgi:hypothetical protein
MPDLGISTTDPTADTLRRSSGDRGHAGELASQSNLGAVRRLGLWLRQGCEIGTFICSGGHGG